MEGIMTSTWFGANMPFTGPGNTVMGRQEDLRLITNDVLQLLYTVPGERVHRPSFGTPLRTTLFDQMSAQTIASLRSAISQAIAQEEPRLSNVDVSLTPEPDSNLLHIKITGWLTNDPAKRFALSETIDVPSAQS
jgi:phage baseplate assembly protein W